MIGEDNEEVNLRPISQFQINRRCLHRSGNMIVINSRLTKVFSLISIRRRSKVSGVYTIPELK